MQKARNPLPFSQFLTLFLSTASSTFYYLWFFGIIYWTTQESNWEYLEQFFDTLTMNQYDRLMGNILAIYGIATSGLEHPSRCDRVLTWLDHFSTVLLLLLTFYWTGWSFSFSENEKEKPNNEKRRSAFLIYQLTWAQILTIAMHTKIIAILLNLSELVDALLNVWLMYDQT